jgi:hypothetical protein
MFASQNSGVPGLGGRLEGLWMGLVGRQRAREIRRSQTGSRS